MGKKDAAISFLTWVLDNGTGTFYLNTSGGLTQFHVQKSDGQIVKSVEPNHKDGYQFAEQQQWVKLFPATENQWEITTSGRTIIDKFRALSNRDRDQELAIAQNEGDNQNPQLQDEDSVSKESMMNFLDWIVDTVFVDRNHVDDTYVFRTDSNRKMRMEKKDAEAFRQAQYAGLIADLGNGVFCLSELGDTLLYQWKKIGTVSIARDSVQLIVEQLSSTHPLLNKGDNRNKLIAECLNSITNLEEKCKLALSVLASCDTVELTSEMISENRRLANLTENILQQNKKLANDTRTLAIATALMATFTFLAVIVSGVQAWEGWQSLRKQEAQKNKMLSNKTNQSQAELDVSKDLERTNPRLTVPPLVKNNAQNQQTSNGHKLGQH